MEKLEIFPIRVETSLVLLTFTFGTRSLVSSYELLDYLEASDIPIHFLLYEAADRDEKTLSIAIHKDNYRQIALELDRLSKIVGIEGVSVRERIGIIRLLGAHFDIRPGIANLIFSALEESGIEMVANSTTITSSLVVVPEAEVQKTVQAIESVFKSPKSNHSTSRALAKSK